MNELIFATHNAHKVSEIRSLLGGNMHIISLDEAGLHDDIPEPHDSLQANAREKAATIYRMTGKGCFSEDTGLEVSALNGAPGVISARYAGPQKSAEDNIKLLLREMDGKSDRNARFRTVISLFYQGKEYQFEGICNGAISEIPTGKKGFGYDPVFIPDGAEKTFSQMTLEEKNEYSHRAKAFEKLISFLAKNIYKTEKAHGKDKNRNA